MEDKAAITSDSTQLQIADFIKAELDNKVLYSPGFGWCFYDGKVWVTGKHGELMAKAEVQTIIRNYGKEHGRVKSRETAASINSIMDLLSGAMTREIKIHDRLIILEHECPDGWEYYVTDT